LLFYAYIAALQSTNAMMPDESRTASSAFTSHIGEAARRRRLAAGARSRTEWSCTINFSEAAEFTSPL
jgi:hypothetical protein